MCEISRGKAIDASGFQGAAPINIGVMGHCLASSVFAAEGDPGDSGAAAIRRKGGVNESEGSAKSLFETSELLASRLVFMLLPSAMMPFSALKIFTVIKVTAKTVTERKSLILFARLSDWVERAMSVFDETANFRKALIPLAPNGFLGFPRNKNSFYYHAGELRNGNRWTRTLSARSLSTLPTTSN